MAPPPAASSQLYHTQVKQKGLHLSRSPPEQTFGYSRFLRNATEITSPSDLLYRPSSVLRQQSYIAGLCACCRALNTNDHSTSHREVISFAFLTYPAPTKGGIMPR
jgi:hypothetical protein